MKNCFIVSFFVNTEDSLLILKNYIETIFKTFDDVTMFIGLNNSPYVDKATNLLNEYGGIYHSVVLEKLSCNSDASGYQLALKLLRDSDKNFDLYWFIHSKAVTTGRRDEREYIFNDFIINKKEIIELFKQNDFIGSYGNMGIKLSTLEPNHKHSTPTISGNFLEKYYRFNIKTPLEFFCAKTFYVIRGNIINTFIKNCNYSFFDTPLTITGDEKTDIYFFERDFLRVVDKMGYIPLFRLISGGISDRRWGDISTIESNEDYLKEVSMWLDINKLNYDKEKVLDTIKLWQKQ